MRTVNNIGWFFFAFFAVAVGLYPISYFLFDMKLGLLGTKTSALLQSISWNSAFYTHIIFGGLSLVVGWTQFSKKIRSKKIDLHRNFGKLYVLAVLFSGVAALYISFFATGGIVPAIGFGSLGALWLFTTGKAYSSIRKLKIERHRHWMIRSYALCFAAVTLRLWLPFFQFFTQMEFVEAYRYIAWLCWVPNLIIAEAIIFNIKRREAKNFGVVINKGRATIVIDDIEQYNN